MTLRAATGRLFRLPGLLLTAVVGLVLPVGAAPTPAARASDFIRSIGANSSVSRRGETLPETVREAKYVGLGWVRAGYESDVPVQDLLELHRQTGVRFSYGLGSGGADIPRLLAGARQLAAAGALIALEGPNEPNNWGVTYQGVQGGGPGGSWLAVAALQRDLYAAVKSDPALKHFPVWTITEGGAETDNVGLQYLTIPPGAHCLMPDGTRYADAANVHNYIYHPNSPGVEDNKTWDAADPTPACRVDGLYGNYGSTWAHHYPGSSDQALLTLPRVTTETGAGIGGAITEDIHGLNILSMCLDQFKRGWSDTCFYLLRDRVDEAGDQQYGLFAPDDTPRKAAIYLHNLTTILADNNSKSSPGTLDYFIPQEPATVHDLLLQKSDGEFDLVVWDEQVVGTSQVTVRLGRAWPSATLYDPTLGTTPTQVFRRVRSLSLALSDHPVVIALPTRSPSVRTSISENRSRSRWASARRPHISPRRWPTAITPRPVSSIATRPG